MSDRGLLEIFGEMVGRPFLGAVFNKMEADVVWFVQGRIGNAMGLWPVTGTDRHIENAARSVVVP